MRYFELEHFSWGENRQTDLGVEGSNAALVALRL